MLSQTGCRPFSADRDGMVMGEGAAVFVLEDWDHARARGADILAEVAGFAMTSDAVDMVQPSDKGAARAMRMALRDAGLKRVDYINAHGTGTTANDRCEAQAIAAVFDTPPPVSSTKSGHGHLMGAAGAVELLACLMALQQGVIAPTLGFQPGDCALDVVPGQARQARVDATLSNSFAFGGLKRGACPARRLITWAYWRPSQPHSLW